MDKNTLIDDFEKRKAVYNNGQAWCTPAAFYISDEINENGKFLLIKGLASTGDDGIKKCYNFCEEAAAVGFIKHILLSETVFDVLVKIYPKETEDNEELSLIDLTINNFVPPSHLTISVIEDKYQKDDAFDIGKLKNTVMNIEKICDKYMDSQSITESDKLFNQIVEEYNNFLTQYADPDIKLILCDGLDSFMDYMEALGWGVKDILEWQRSNKRKKLSREDALVLNSLIQLAGMDCSKDKEVSIGWV